MLVLVDKRRSFSHPDLKEGKIKNHYFVDLMRRKKKKAFLVVYVRNKLSELCKTIIIIVIIVLSKHSFLHRPFRGK